MIIEGPASTRLSERVASKIEEEIVSVESKVFPDGEIYIRLDGDVKGQDCCLIQTTYPNENLLSLFFIQDALIRSGARSIATIVPYYSYSRQDQIFEKGEALSSEVIAKIIEFNSDKFYSVDLHSSTILNYFDITAYNLSAMMELADHSQIYDPDLLLSPDEGGIDRIKLAAEEVDLRWDYLEKHRLDGESVEIKPKNMDVEGKTVVILDDIISTGGTMGEAARQLYEQGADEVHAGCTHGLFIGDSLKRLESVCESVFCTDTIESPSSEVTVAPLIAEAINDT